MTLEPSAWRANDAVTMDVARDAANIATALLFTLADQGVHGLDDAVAEATEIRLELHRTDGFDRGAVDAFLLQLDARIAELRGLTS